VSQEPVLFAASVRENIAYGKDNATDEEIRAAAELAIASKFIDKMPRVRKLVNLSICNFHHYIKKNANKGCRSFFL
jgi:ABC-type multidrug transport system fused ATPase/permease subunit